MFEFNPVFGIHIGIFVEKVGMVRRKCPYMIEKWAQMQIIDAVINYLSMLL